MIASAPGLLLGAAAAANALSLPLSLGNFQPQSRAAVWQPKVGTQWQIVLASSLNIDVANPSVAPDHAEVFDIDLFTNTRGGTDDSKIRALHSLGKRVICYFSAGTYEEGRPDSAKFTAADKGNAMAEWPENWVNIMSANVRAIMTKRIELAARMGCDAIDPDNLDGYGEAPVNNKGKNTEFKLSKEFTIDYVKWLAAQAKENNLAVGLKNAAEVIPSVLDHVQFSVNEECVAMKECNSFLAFIAAGKPVFHIEYPNGEDHDDRTPVADTKKWCSSAPDWSGPNADIRKMSTVIKDMGLSGWTQYCDKKEYTTATGNRGQEDEE